LLATSLINRFFLSRLFLNFLVVWLLSIYTAWSAPVKLGSETMAALGYPGLQGKRLGLVTNPSGVNSSGVSTVDLLRQAKGVKLVALFGPEHGVYGDILAGDYVPTQRDKRTGLVVHSLYGETRKPTPTMLRDLDVIVYDMQDVGARSYTFISTLGLVMQAAAENGKEVVVLDRPNPLGGERIEGAGVDSSLRSFVGQYDIPYVYGLTPGEMAAWINDRYLARPCRLTVFKMKGWNRRMAWPETGLRWVATSPNIPHWESALGYTATGLLGDLGITNGANVHPRPFMVVAGERIDEKSLAARLKMLQLRGIGVAPTVFYPSSGRYRHVPFRGVELKLDPHSPESFLKLNYQILDSLKIVQPQKNYFSSTPADSLLMFDKINGGTGNRRAWLSGKSADELARTWTVKENAWRQERKKYLLY
jgi:uncharacterized protein YbbC (DUF1343 family)